VKTNLKKTIETYNEIAHHYKQKTKNLELVDEIKKFKKFLPKNAKVLDAGCGWGRDSKILAKSFSVIGIDLSEKLLDLAKAYASKAKFQIGDISKTNFPDNTFHGIWANDILLHLDRKDILPTLKEFHRLLKSSGILYVSVKEGEGESWEEEEMSNFKPRFYTWFKEDEIIKYFKKAGFRIIETAVFYEKKKLGLKRNLGIITCFVEKI
jgi:ubiquinone/menaquinone biosynthesis C-methylase UbiE